MAKSDGASLVGDWESIISNWDSILSTSRKVVIRSLRVGIPSKYRSVLWGLLTGAAEAKKEAGFTYDSVLSQQSADLRIIDCDVPRTFPALCGPERPRVRASLRNVLIAYSNADPEVGYVQGMNFIAGMFVLHEKDEETAFWCFYGLMARGSKPYRAFFQLSFPRLRREAELVDRLLSERYPVVYGALRAFQLNAIVLVPHWYNSCFLDSDVDNRMATFLFDQFVAFGAPVLLSFGMTVVSFLAETLETQGTDQILTLMTNSGQVLHGKSKQQVNMAWNREWITNVQYEKMCRELIDQQARQKRAGKPDEIGARITS
jgi:hypothetical protein